MSEIKMLKYEKPITVQVRNLALLTNYEARPFNHQNDSKRTLLKKRRSMMKQKLSV